MTDEQLNGIAMKMLTYSGKAKSILSDLMDHLNSSSHDSDIDAQLNEAQTIEFVIRKSIAAFTNHS
ncbi:hypothetical protein OKF32_01425 [Lentilactobacillus buchneri]|nr:hypothetical protein OKF32_01425 [Lentilactobacillus sp. Egmn17]